MREGSNSSPVYICMHPLYICIHAHHQCKMSVRMRVRERASLSEIKGGKDAEGGRDLGLEKQREG